MSIGEGYGTGHDNLRTHCAVSYKPGYSILFKVHEVKYNLPSEIFIFASFLLPSSRGHDALPNLGKAAKLIWL